MSVVPDGRLQSRCHPCGGWCSSDTTHRHSEETTEPLDSLRRPVQNNLHQLENGNMTLCSTRAHGNIWVGYYFTTPTPNHLKCSWALHVPNIPSYRNPASVSSTLLICTLSLVLITPHHCHQSLAWSVNGKVMLTADHHNQNIKTPCMFLLCTNLNSYCIQLYLR